MKDGVIIVNTARPGIFDTKVLADFLAAGKVRSCGVDVFEEEPCTTSPLHEFPNAILTPHIAAVTYEAQQRAGAQIAEYIWEGLEGFDRSHRYQHIAPTPRGHRPCGALMPLLVR